ncbi:hypothetical protein [Lactiplantibacillus xiangfangensis]|uniref:Aminoglycoside phosphotransferase domain-containing protein n=1 Tax=Lactiplantibacillus xiangfangensis TaxID=942150 RepID=A0A0R2MCJ6_9LACO|nr:hypothetical protein [Lactiplantibacillus xiangfangensis]KRO09075.1 hypothetical protein IV64_GL000202 [Lactiplantibacillus xiangfangensis]
MDYFETQINQWADWEAVRNNATIFAPLIKQIYSSENEMYKSPETVADETAAVFSVGLTQIVIFPPSHVMPTARERYQTERFSLTRMKRLKVTAPEMRHAGFIFDAYQFYYVIYQPLAGVCLADFATTAEPLAKSTLGRQIGTALNQINGETGSFNHIDARKEADAADWTILGSDFKAEREALLDQHPVATTDFVHGQLTGTNLVVTSGQVGFQHFVDARQAPRQTELVPLIFDAFQGDSDFLTGLKATLSSADLALDLMLGLLWRADGPAYIQQLMGSKPVTLATVQAAVTTLVTHHD